MEPEQLKKITGYFIEEAREHLETITQGLVDLSKTIATPDDIHECYRGAHSIKGGAAMLALESIRLTAHRLEDYFKYLKENPVPADQYMKTSFAKLKQALQTQVDRLEQSPDLTLSEAEASDLMAVITPIFGEMPAHLEQLAHGTTTAIPTKTLPPNFAPDVLSKLRELLRLFKQPDSAANRRQALDHAKGLTALGKQANLPTWVTLMQVATTAIGNPDNSPKILASKVVKEIKQAHDLIVANRAEEIVPSSQLQALVPVAKTSPQKARINSSSSSPTPEVGSAELDNLAILFSHEITDLEEATPAIASRHNFNQEEQHILGSNNNQDLNDLFSGLDDDEGLEDISHYDSADMSFLMTEIPQPATARLPQPKQSTQSARSIPASVEDSPVLMGEELNDLLDLNSVDLFADNSDNLDYLDSLSSLDLELDLSPASNLDDLNLELFDDTDNTSDNLNFDDFDNIFSDQETVLPSPPKLPNQTTDQSWEDLLVESSSQSLDFGGEFSPGDSRTDSLEGSEFDALSDFFAAPESILEGFGAEETRADSSFDDLFSESPASAQSWDDLDMFAASPTSEVTLDDLFGNALDEETSTSFTSSRGAIAETALEENIFDLDLDQDPSLDQDYRDFDELETMLGDSNPSQEAFAFDELETMLGESSGLSPNNTNYDFADLDDLLEPAAPAKIIATNATNTTNVTNITREAKKDSFGFDELEGLLEETEKSMGGSRKSDSGSRNTTVARPQRGVGEQTMRVPVKQLDNLNNLMGELVVNRNTLEQDQGRLREFLDNLIRNIQQLTDVGGRMQDLYERSLLESSLLASRQKNQQPTHQYLNQHSRGDESHRQGNSGGDEYDPLEMDRFTGFHLLSQEMIELIVRVKESASDIEFLVQGTDQVARMLRQITDKLQEGLNRSRMMPFKQTADRLPRAVRDICVKLQKQAELKVEGQDTLVDKMILEQLYDPMTHLVNNAMTHGIETPEVRQRAGKPALGRIQIKAFHQGNQTIISVGDDGAGIDPEVIRRKIIEKNLVTATEAQKLSKIELYDYLFHAGFSTKDKADDFSGRGVGMDVVRTKLNEIRGTVGIDSTLGKGTTFTIRLPLTLSIGKALRCLSDHSLIAFPIDGVEQPMDEPLESLETHENGHFLYPWNGEKLEVYPLSELLTFNRHISRGNLYGGQREDGMISIVILRGAGNYLAVQVDQVLGEQEIVTKQLEGPAPKPVGIAGATVMGDGKIMPIVDVLELIDLSLGRLSKDKGGMLWDQSNLIMTEPIPIKTEPLVLIVDDSITVRELLSMTFTKSGYRVEQARDGQEAWDKMRSGLPCDIVFCDIEMPKMDGLELLDRMHKDEILKNLPIAMLTSRGADRHRQIAAERGARGYFTKPYLEDVLLDAAQRMIKGEVLLHVNAPVNA